MTDKRRNFGLDAIRAIAILLVLHIHTKFIWQGSKFEFMDFSIIDGVDLFFVLSGYLIGSIILKEYIKPEGITFRNIFSFWKRRWFRTLPLYIFILLLNILLNELIFKHEYQTPLWKFPLFLQNFRQPMIGNFFLESWSLAVEEWFYILIPSIFIIGSFLLKETNKRLYFSLTGCLAVIVIAILLRYRMLANTGPIEGYQFDIYFRKLVTLRIDSIVYGVIGAHLTYLFPKLWSKQFRLAAIFGFLFFIPNINTALSPFIPNYKYIWFYTLFGIACVSIIPFMESLPKPTKVLNLSLTAISKTSYSMYLIHLPIVQLSKYYFNDWLIKYPGTYFILFLGLTFIISYTTYKLIEIPFLKLRDYKLTNR